ncbi:Macrolide export ATP-binding/permease protein MacB [Photorhabdus australis subsp. thailandensis]|uniref:Macrolide export ATP-binding/permease protein MacB n=2 Tax=Photorhabdus australis TaxID=286156 RepID=A0A1C0U601_9GAMM|nr:Macrolide export ATP-binding/permease protein MacB [Photorhabdus australis subsp. thailandensis]
MFSMSSGRHGLSLAQALRESLDSLRLLGRRSLLALLGIAVGCASVIALLNIGYNAANEAISTFKSMGSNILVAHFSFIPGVDVKPAPSTLDVQALTRTLPTIAYAAPITLYSTHVRFQGRGIDTNITGTSPDLVKVLNLQIEQGRFLSGYDRQTTYTVVGANIAKQSKIQVGSQLQIGDYLFEVIGILSVQGVNPLLPVPIDDSVILPIEGMRRLRPAPEIGSIIAKTHDTTTLNSDATLLRHYLISLSKGRNVEVQIPQQLLDGLTRQTKTFSYLLAGLGGISLLVGGVGVMNVMLMNVSERRREIGVRMALGARPIDIGVLFMLEAATLAIAGAIVGSLLGVAVGYLFVKFSGWVFTLSPFSVPLGIVSSLVIGLFFGINPALAAAKLQPIEALRDD